MLAEGSPKQRERRLQKMNSIIRFGIRLPGLTVAVLSSLCGPAAAFGQNCALCYTQAGGAGSRMIQALRSGILIMVIPPVLICLGLTVMAYRKRNQFNEGLPVDPS
jgi:hypothetical protein